MKSKENQLPRKEPTNQDGTKKSHKIKVLVQIDHKWVMNGVKEVTVVGHQNIKNFEWDKCMSSGQD